MPTEVKIPLGVRNAMDGLVPLVVGTADAEGTPNITFMSQLYYVDEQHAALSYQFMNKTWRNMRHNPFFTVLITNPEDCSMWKLELKFLEEKKEGPIFEEMEMQLLALATPQHIQFNLHSALICRLVSYEQVFAGSTT